MRPVRIEVEGFSAYRELVEVDFEGVDFFSLSGPTGSGKSSLVDAMIFALYGRVPRLGGNAVAPAITAGTDRARVRFYFEVDEVVYDATRMAQRTASGGASVREARLQAGDEVLANGPGDVSARVEDLLRLGFEDFTRTVVLPQGEFARFLQATKAERQGLLRNLLGLDVFTTMRELARTRAAIATESAAGATRALEDLDVADAETREAAVSHRDALVNLAEGLSGKEKSLAELDLIATKAAEAEESIGEALRRLQAIEPPDRLEELESLAADARSRLVEGEEARVAAADALRVLEDRAADLPTSDQVTMWKRTLERLGQLDEQLGSDDLDVAKLRLDEAESALQDGLVAAEAARKAIADARTEHAAHLLAGALVAGEPCPVCSQTVAEPPQPAPRPELARLESAETEAEAEVTRLRAVVEEARAVVAGLEAGRIRLGEQREDLTGDLEGSPDDLEALETQMQLLRDELEQARARVTEATGRVEMAQKELEDLADASRQVARRLTEAQLSVAALEPPVSQADDVTVQWKELLLWRDQAIDRLTEERAAAVDRAAAARDSAVDARAELADVLSAHGVEPIEPFAVQVATALQTARSLVERHEKAVERSASLKTEIEDASGRAAVAETLAGHLKANGFEQWLMSGALVDLVTGANDLLDQLSDGGYSLHSDDSGSFSIVDHRNADEMRRVETLSGGETFLVSLALALSLAETLAAQGGSRLDAIILDEGFGSLDDESLDIVASVLEELTGRGLMVGVITHVKELAARAPVRYEVTREPKGSQVRRAS